MMAEPQAVVATQDVASGVAEAAERPPQGTGAAGERLAEDAAGPPATDAPTTKQPEQLEPVKHAPEAPVAAEANSAAGAVPDPALAQAPAAASPAGEATDELFHLFLGSLPRDCQESTLEQYLNKYGTLVQVACLRDMQGGCTGSGFALFERRADAEAAIAGLNGQVTLPGMPRPIEVRFAKRPTLIRPGTGPEDNRELFFSGAPAGVDRRDMQELLEFYGKVEKLQMLTDPATRRTRGSGFVTYAARQAALDALAALHGSYTVPGAPAPLVVRWSDPQFGEKRKRADAQLSERDRQLFVAKILKSSPEEEGSGVITFLHREDAEAAIRALDEVYVWPGMKETMIVKWMDSPDDFKRRRDSGTPVLAHLVSTETPPPGCDRDALKLHVGNIPTACSVEDIRAVFKPFGRVVQILVARDKATHMPTGSAHVWYQKRREAEPAIRKLHGSKALHHELRRRREAEAALLQEPLIGPQLPPQIVPLRTEAGAPEPAGAAALGEKAAASDAAPAAAGGEAAAVEQKEGAKEPPAFEATETAEAEAEGAAEGAAAKGEKEGEEKPLIVMVAPGSVSTVAPRQQQAALPRPSFMQQQQQQQHSPQQQPWYYPGGPAGPQHYGPQVAMPQGQPSFAAPMPRGGPAGFPGPGGYGQAFGYGAPGQQFNRPVGPQQGYGPVGGAWHGPMGLGAMGHAPPAVGPAFGGPAYYQQQQQMQLPPPQGVQPWPPEQMPPPQGMQHPWPPQQAGPAVGGFGSFPPR
eukprot:scaffold2.g6782.t1